MMGSTQENPPSFYIDRILGLEKPERCLKLHRPWAELGPERTDRGGPLVQRQRQAPEQQQISSRPAADWYVGRRPRTAFSSSQVSAMETVFQVNCYPGIQLREQLAGKLHLDEDRIQIWFQNRRAKLRRSHRETQLCLVQTAVTDLEVRPEVVGHQSRRWEGPGGELQSPQQQASPLQLVMEH